MAVYRGRGLMAGRGLAKAFLYIICIDFSGFDLVKDGANHRWLSVA